MLSGSSGLAVAWLRGLLAHALDYRVGVLLHIADALVIFSCAGRQVALGPMINREIEGLNNIWKVPLVGFFSNAELARANGGNLECIILLIAV